MGQSSRSQVAKIHGMENVFGAGTADGGRSCAINSYVLDTNLNTTIAVVEFCCAKVVGATSCDGFSSLPNNSANNFAIVEIELSLWWSRDDIELQGGVHRGIVAFLT